MATECIGRKAVATSLGFKVSEGRGRMPKDVAAAVDAALAKGSHVLVDKDGNPVGPKPAVKVVPKSDKPAKVRQVKTSDVLEPAPQLWPDSLKVTEVATGKVRSNREACCNCRVSLQWCQCHLRNPAISPMLVGHRGLVAVRLEV